MKNKYTRLCLLAVGTLAAAALIACGGGGGRPGRVGGTGGTGGTLGGGAGSLKVSLTDAPACGFDAVNVTVTKVRVHPSATAVDTDTGWVDITLNPARKINLLNLTGGVLDTLGTTSLAAGKYTQVRLLLDPNTGGGVRNSVVRTGGNGVEVSLDTPAAAATGFRIQSDIDVLNGQQYDLVIDFDACNSIIDQGSNRYALSPVLKTVAGGTGNGITGFVSTTLLSSNVGIAAQQNGNVLGTTVPNATTGQFTLSRLMPGNYDVVIVADGRSAAVVGGVPVPTASSSTAISTQAAPITLPATLARSISGTVSITPADKANTVIVSARQTMAGGPTVTLQAVGINANTGLYTLTSVPTGAPQYAVYSAALPLGFSSNNTSLGLGRYRVDASAPTYVTRSSPTVDVSGANQTNVNLTMTP